MHWKKKASQLFKKIVFNRVLKDTRNNNDKKRYNLTKQTSSLNIFGIQLIN